MLDKMAQLENPCGCKRFIYTTDCGMVRVIAFDDNGWTGESEMNKFGARNFWNSLVLAGWKAAIASKLTPELTRQGPA